MLKDLARQELLSRIDALSSERYNKQRSSLYEFLKYYRERERKIHLDENWHIELICSELEKVHRGETKRLIINIPPRSLKTEITSITFPAWCLGHDHKKKFMEISYSAGLAEKNSGLCRQMYNSQAYKLCFPTTPPLKEDQNTKKHWENTEGGQYYASGSDGTITGVGADIIIIDDPMKPGDAMSETVRPNINNNFHDTIESRLNDKTQGAIVIIMQRLHDDDLCGHLLDLQQQKRGEERRVLMIPAIAEEDDMYRKQGESFFPKRFPIHILHHLKAKDQQTFSSQYQQNPVSKETQEFHEERIRYHGEGGVDTPKNLRVFTTCDPAFKEGQENDNSCIMTGGFLNDKMFILEYSVGKRGADVLLDKLIYHIGKWKPEKCGIEAFQAQSMIITFLKSELTKRRMYVDVEEVKQTGDKLSKIRKLVPLYRNGLIYHRHGMDELETELKRFPRGKHDDIIDAEQMLYDLYVLQPNTITSEYNFKMEYDHFGRPIDVAFTNNERLNV